MSQVVFSFVELPNKDVNETSQLHDEEIFVKLLQERKFIFSDEEKDSGVADQLQSVEDVTGRRAGLKHQFLNVTSWDTTQTLYLQPLDFLQQKDLLKSLNQLIEKAEIIGEENSRLLLFLITIR